jgi:hypothetical protein
MIFTSGSLTGFSSPCSARSRFSCSISASSARRRSSTLPARGALPAYETLGPAMIAPASAPASHRFQVGSVHIVGDLPIVVRERPVRPVAGVGCVIPWSPEDGSTRG